MKEHELVKPAMERVELRLKPAKPVKEMAK